MSYNVLISLPVSAQLTLLPSPTKSCVFSGLDTPSWLRGPAVEHRSLAGVLSLSCARLAADG